MSAETELDADLIAALPRKVRSALVEVIVNHQKGLTGSLVIHYKDGIPQHRNRTDTERF